MKSPEGDVRLLRGFPYPSVAAGSSECQAGRVADSRADAQRQKPAGDALVMGTVPWVSSPCAKIIRFYKFFAKKEQIQFYFCIFAP